MMDKMCKKLLLVTELIFCNTAKANGKILLGFCRGNQGDPNLWVGLQKYAYDSILFIELKTCSVIKGAQFPNKWLWGASCFNESF